MYTIVTTTCLKQNDDIITPIDPGTGGGGGGGSTGGGENPHDPPCDTSIIPSNPESGFTDENGCPIGTPTIPNLPNPKDDPCEKTKAIYNNTAVKSRYEILKGKTSEPSESGYGFKTVPDGNGGTTTQTNPLNPDTNPDKMKVGIYPTSYGYIHTHLDKANGKMAVKIFSPADINTFLAFLHNAQTNGIPFGSIFGGMIASDPNTGHNIYQMIYTGDGTDLPAELTDDQLKALKTWYRDEAQKIANDNDGILSHPNMQTLLFKLLKKMNMKNVVLSKIEYSTTTYKTIKFDNNGNSTEETCP